METVNNLFVKTCICISLLLPGASVFSQDYKALQDAFSNSYSLEKAGKYQAAVDVIKKNFDESSYEMNVRLGWLHYMAGSFSEALNCYSRAIKLMPYSIEARLGYAYPAASLGNWEAVIGKYQEILKIDPSNYLATYRLASIYYTRKDYASAYKLFEKLVNMYPFDYDVLHMFAWTNYQMGKYREAKVLFNKTLLNRPGDASAMEGLGMIK
ncbi:MAG: tetratricopeptide repeat protein [Bacteroidetes bacterium]|nr:tetratricopeptide repeat protein [Bacteroidota bacterium]